MNFQYGFDFEPKNRLSWSTASEQNFSRFEVERSEKASGDWTLVGEVAALGSGNEIKSLLF